MKKIIHRAGRIVLAVVLTGLTFTGCYREEHFDFPGPFEIDQRVPDSLPFPFDENRQAGVWLMKDGVPDYGKILFKGYTDYYPAHDTTSWSLFPDGMHMIPHRNYYPITDDDHFGGNPNSFRFNWALSKYFVPVGAGKSFYMYAKVTIGTFSGTALALRLGRSWETKEDFNFGMDGFNAIAPQFFLNFYGTTIGVNPADGWPSVNEVIVPGVPAEIEVVIHDGRFYTLINGTLCFTFKFPQGQTYYYTPAIRPWRNFVYVHEMYLESNDLFTVDYAMHEQEQGYARIQSPALASAGGKQLLLFAEGRSNPRTAEERVVQNTFAAGDTDILMKRSSDGGISWDEQLTVVAGAGSGETYCFPQTVTTADGKIILHYSKLSGSISGSTGYEYDPVSQEIYQVESADGGNSWSTPVAITAALTDGTEYVRSGPSHGVSLRSPAYAGRLVMPLTRGENTVLVALSDDNGASWRLSGQIPGNGLQYGSVVELEDGRLMLVTGHNRSTPRSRMVSYSSNGGETWTPAEAIAVDFATGSDGHLYPGLLVKGPDGTIYNANATGREKDSETYNGPTFGTNPVLFSSTDDGQTFASHGQLFGKQTYEGYATPTGFMDGVVLEDGTLVLVNEGGVESPQEGIVVYRK